MAELAIILVFIGAVVVLGLVRGFRARTAGENIYYILSTALCLTVLLLKSLDLWQLDPLQSLAALFHRYGLSR